MPFFSVVIPTLNEEKYLPNLLNDLVRQKEKDFEVLVIDGESDDKTKDLALKFRNKLNLRFFLSEKKNVSYQRNLGAKKAKGKYLIFLDADSRIYSTFIKKLKYFITKKKGLVLIPEIIPDKRDGQIEIIFQFVNFLIEISHNLKKPFSAGGNMIFEKNFFFLINGFDEKLFLGEDHQIIQKAALFGTRPKYLKGIKVKLSLRRLRKEGKLKVFYKYLLATAHIFFKGDIKEKIFDYQMGGLRYKKYKKKLNKNFFKKQFKETKKFFISQFKHLKKLGQFKLS